MREKHVTHGVDSCPLLEEHGDCCNDNTLKHSLGLKERSNGDKLELESVRSGLCLQMRELLSQTSLLKERLGLDLEEFQFDEFVVSGKISEVG